MDPIAISIVGIVAMFALILLKVPVGVAMAMSGFFGYGLLGGFGPALSIVVAEPTGVLKSYELAVIPLFLLMGSFATAGGLSAEIYHLAAAFVGHRRGGLAMATIGGCAIFGAVCGSSPATAATFGRVALPEMRRRGYATSFASGCIAAGGTLGALVPPSIVMVIYAVLARQPVLDIFIAALVPAAIAVVLHLAAIVVFTRVRADAGPAAARIGWRDRLIAVRRCWLVIILLVVVIGGIYGGVFTVNEAAAVGAALSFLFALLRGRLTWRSFLAALDETATGTAMIYLIIFGASIFTYFFTASGAPEAAVDGIKALGMPPMLVIVALLVMYLFLGAFFETVSAMLITLPFVLPLVVGLGYDPIWWAIINVVVIELGMITPPIGLNVFVLKGVAEDVPLATIYRGVTPFIAADVVRLGLLTVFPGLSLWLLHYMS
jgi:tripartite ATP-independent transporter DctM subunit